MSFYILLAELRIHFSPLLPKEVCIPKEKKRKESTEQFLTQTEFQVMEYGASKVSILFLKRLTELTT